MTTDVLPYPLRHPCCHPGCGREGCYGHGVSLRLGRLGRWWCREHVPDWFWDNKLRAEGKHPAVAAKRPADVPGKAVKKPVQGRLF